MNLYPPKIIVTLLLISILLIAFMNANAQQDVIANKMNTRTDVTRPFNNSVDIPFLTATRLNNMNEVRWSAFGGQNTRRYIVEYSTDGIYFQSAGEVLASSGNYGLKHQISEIHPLIYRIKVEAIDGRSSYSKAIFLDGEENLAVKVYPTILTEKTVHATAVLPVDKITINSGSGQQIITEYVGGKGNYLSIPLPSSLSSGMYWITFAGRGWQTTSKFIIP